MVNGGININRHTVNKLIFIGVKSEQKSMIACHCTKNFGVIELFVGCRWKLVDENCPSVLFSQALNSTYLDDSFNNRTFTEDSLEAVNETHNDTSTQEDSGHDTSMTLLKEHLEDLKQQLEQVKEQLNSVNSIQVIRGMIT